MWKRHRGISETKNLLQFHVQVFLSIHIFLNTLECMHCFFTNSDYSTLHICVLIDFNEIFDLVYFQYLHIWPKMTFCPLFDLWPSLVLLSSIFLYNFVYQVLRKNNKAIKMRQEPIKSFIIDTCISL